MADEKQTALATVEPAGLPEPVIRRGISEPAWRTLCNSLFPGADPKSVLMVVDYCKARGLDPLKKPCHIVPMEVHDARNNTYVWRDVVMPGIYEYRTTAHRTGEYLGHSDPEFGPDISYHDVKAPEWCAITVFRFNKLAQAKVPFPVKVFFSEVVATKKGGAVNARWTRAPKQMLTKCAEAAAIREAFPEEIGGEATAEELDGQRAIDITPTRVADEVVNLLDKLPEAMRDLVERGLSALNLSIGQKQVKINEFLAGDGVDVEDGAVRLLAWCQAELKAPKKPAPDNGRKNQVVAAPSVPPDSAQAPLTAQDIKFGF